VTAANHTSGRSSTGAARSAPSSPGSMPLGSVCRDQLSMCSELVGSVVAQPMSESSSTLASWCLVELGPLGLVWSRFDWIKPTLCTWFRFAWIARITWIKRHPCLDHPDHLDA
jgi:hypothetical protein